MRKMLILFFVLLTISLSAQDDWKFSGQIQLRSELDGRDFSNKTHALTFSSLRSRFAVEKNVLNKLNFFVQLQDSRVFGEEGNTLASIKNVDLHQAYVILKEPFDWNMEIQAGRFEVAYGTERFFGAVGWHYVARAWDGVRFKFPCIGLDAFALTHTETNSYIANAVPSAYPYPEKATPAYSVYGLWEQANINSQNKLDVFGYYQLNRMTVNNEYASKVFTLGASHFGNYGSFSSIAEAAYQFGKMSAADVSAYLVSLQGNYTAGAHKFGAGIDLLSGTDETSDKYNTFNPAFGTNHKFYGFMDYFINIPGNTFQAGLNDFYLMYNYQPADCDWETGINFHQFMTNKEFKYQRTVIIGGDGIQTTDESSSSFGQEIDLTVKYKFIKGTAISWGGSVFLPGDIMKAAFSLPEFQREDLGFWSYLMITAAIN